MKIILIKPYQESNEIIPPLGLGYLASAVREKHDVEIWDGILENFTLKKIRKKLSACNADVIGIQMFSSDIATVQYYVKIVKEELPHAIIVVGGPHPSSWPEHVFKVLPQIDYAFNGEAEIGFAMLMDHIQEQKEKQHPHWKVLPLDVMKTIPGLIFRFEDKIHINPKTFTEDLDKYSPSYDLLHLEKYPLAPHGSYCKQHPVAPILLTRGCPFSCNFCNGPVISGLKIRHHSIPYIINLLKKLRREYNIREFHIEDDNFTVHKKFAKEFCQALIDLDLGFTWTAANGIRLDTLDDELLSLMVRSGMYSISFGIEAGSERVRRLMGKNLPNKILFKKIRLLKKYPIDLIGFFIIGYPGETRKEIDLTIKMAMQLPLKRANFSAFKPLPGTKIFEQLIKEKKLTKINWNKLTLHSVAWADSSIGVDELEKLRRKALWKFYFRPKILFGLFKDIKNLYNLKMILFRIYRLLLRNIF